jgi:hypothetical protein
MKKTFTLIAFTFVLIARSHSQVLLNELYTDPGAGKHEFFELYNTNPSSLPLSTNNMTIVTFFDISGVKGFYIMDLPNMTIAARDYFVGASALPFNYQGVTGSTSADFNWNSAAFLANQGYVRKWNQGVANLLDGNLFYDQAALPANFNDFFFRRTANGASYTVFLYNNGTLVNSFVGGAGGSATIINDIVNMPSLFVDMTGASTDFTINFTGYASIPVENTIQDAGSDNGFIREADGVCFSWTKSSAQVQHTPKKTNGVIGGNTGVISVQSALNRGTAATGSTVTYDVVSAPSTSFPVTLEVYLDNGTSPGAIDAGDTYVTSNVETIVSDGPFTTLFFPYDASILIIVKAPSGCIDKMLYIPNAPVLSVKLLSFTGSLNDNMVTLSWKVDENQSLSKYQVEKSIDGYQFNPIGTVDASTAKGEASYSYTDPMNGASRAVYRLKLIYRTGRIITSWNWACLNDQNDSKSLRVLGNPVSDMLQANFKTKNIGKVQISLVSTNGSQIFSTSQVVSRNGNVSIQIPLSDRVKSGIYLLHVIDGKDVHSAKVMVTHFAPK